jgi:ADP-ribose pyrophosphatase YjhB (NUDIX family)
MKEYFGDIEKKESLLVKNMPLEDYKRAHAGLCIPCHDAFIEYQGGILLAKRNGFPDKGRLWPLGGRVSKGLKIEDSLKDKVEEECGLKLKDIILLGVGRTLFRTDPFSHEKGTDTINFAFFSRGEGKLSLDRLHSDPVIVTPKNYGEIRKVLHPFVQDFMDKALLLI